MGKIVVMRVRFLHYDYLLDFQNLPIHKQMSTRDVVYQMVFIIDDAPVEISHIEVHANHYVQLILAAKAM